MTRFKLLPTIAADSSCQVRATDLYLAVHCADFLNLYGHTDGTTPILMYEGQQSVSSVAKTLQHGISWIEDGTVHHFNSQGIHNRIAAKGENHFYINDQLSALRNQVGSYTKFYSETGFEGSIVLPGGVPYSYGTNTNSTGIIQFLACSHSTVYC